MKTIMSIFSYLGLLLLTVLPLSAATAATAETRYVQVGDSKIAYRSIGKGSTLVLANRMRGTLDTWDPLFLDKLAESHTVITFDYPGIGYSAGKLPPDMVKVAEFIEQLVVALKLDKFAVGGWSWGGFSFQSYLLAYPHRVTHAVLMGTNPPGPGQIPIEKVFLDRAFKPVNDLADEEVLFFEPESEFSRRMAKASRDRIYARPGVVDRIPSKFEEIQAFISAHDTFREDKLGRREQLLKTRIPILIICGDHDTSTQAENWYPLVGKFSNAQLVVYPESGHGPQHQYPELTARYITDFIKYTSR
jgi:pimeloyl-ACP methyl ester carboxylesterase